MFSKQSFEIRRKNKSDFLIVVPLKPHQSIFTPIVYSRGVYHMFYILTSGGLPQIFQNKTARANKMTDASNERTKFSQGSPRYVSIAKVCHLNGFIKHNHLNSLCTRFSSNLKKEERKMGYLVCRERRTRKNLSLGWESNPWPPIHRSDALTTELLGDWWRARPCLLQVHCDMRPTHC